MIDVIVVNYRTNGDLLEFIQSFEAFAPDEAQLFVVDVDKVGDFWYEPCENYIICLENIGFNKACNLAATLGTGDIIALFNADVTLGPTTIQDCAQALRENDYDIVGPLQYNQRGKVTHAGIFGTHARPKHRGWNDWKLDEYRDVKEAISVSGSAYFIKRTVWEDLTSCPIYQNVFPDAKGAFLPVQHYYGETGCSYHAYAHGYKVVYYGKAECVHKWHRASGVGTVEATMHVDQKEFRRFCDEHSIPRD